MFNEQDRRCAAIQFILSTDQSYDNRTIACTHKMKIWIVTCPGWWKQSFRLRLWFLVWFQWGPHHATSHLRSRLESQHQSVPECPEQCGDALVESGDRWQTLAVTVGLGTGPQVQRDPDLASEGVLRLCTLLSLVPLFLRPEPAELLRLVIRREHH